VSAVLETMPSPFPNRWQVVIGAVVCLAAPVVSLAAAGAPRAEPLREIKTEKNFPVRDFGAIPDDDKPDAAAICAALAAAVKAGQPARIVFEPGVYEQRDGLTRRVGRWSRARSGHSFIITRSSM
jgi:hypothetical protein